MDLAIHSERLWTAPAGLLNPAEILSHKTNQLAASIKKIAPSIPIILLTGFANTMKVSIEKLKHVDYLLSKPTSLDDFRKALRKVIA